MKAFIGTYGTRKREATAPLGFMTSNIGEWLVKERSFETTVAHIIIFSGAVFLVVGLFFGVVFTRDNVKGFVFEGSSYKIVGIAEMQDGERKIYTPVYEVKK